MAKKENENSALSLEDLDQVAGGQRIYASDLKSSQIIVRDETTGAVVGTFAYTPGDAAGYQKALADARAFANERGLNAAAVQDN